MDRRAFVRATLAGTAALALAPYAEASALAFGRRRADFCFTRLRYESGDWDVDQRMPANVLNSLVEYTTLRVDPRERVVALGSSEVLRLAPFCYLAGHKLVQFSAGSATSSSATCATAASSSWTTATTTSTACSPRRSRPRWRRIFGAGALRKLPRRTRSTAPSSRFPDGPPATGIELNGWGDDLVHDYLKGIELDGRLALLYSNKDYGCEWDYDFRNKRFLAEDNTKFAVNIVLYAMTG